MFSLLQEAPRVQKASQNGVKMKQVQLDMGQVQLDKGPYPIDPVPYPIEPVSFWLHLGMVFVPLAILEAQKTHNGVMCLGIMISSLQEAPRVQKLHV